MTHFKGNINFVTKISEYLILDIKSKTQGQRNAVEKTMKNRIFESRNFTLFPSSIIGMTPLVCKVLLNGVKHVSSLELCKI